MSNSAINLLAYIQQKLNGDLPDCESIKATHLSMLDEMESKWGTKFDKSNVIDRINQMYSDLPTKFQNPLTYSLLKDIIKNIKDTVEKNSEELSLKFKIENNYFPIFGTVSMGQFSAQICSPKNSNDSLIIFSDGLFGFANLISKVIASCLPCVKDKDGGLSYSTDKNNIKNNIKHDNLLIVRFIDLMFAYMMREDPHRAQQYLIDKEHLYLSELIRDSFEIFVAAHEYAHYALGHLSDSTSEKLFDFSSEKIEAISYKWKQEFEADELGAYLTVLYMGSRGIDTFLSGLGIWVCLSVIEVIEKLKATYEDKDLDLVNFSTTHPPISLRKEFLIKHYSEIQAAKKFFDSIDYVFNILWNCFYKFFDFIKELQQKTKLDISDLNFETIQHLLYKIDFTSTIN
ncbi:MAG: hypothetical protein J1G07_01850 [Clostridiales bacterium]|nr:hypothetical protein [Clostridiales bacterium]